MSPFAVVATYGRHFVRKQGAQAIVERQLRSCLRRRCRFGEASTRLQLSGQSSVIRARISVIPEGRRSSCCAPRLSFCLCSSVSRSCRLTNSAHSLIIVNHDRVVLPSILESNHIYYH